jgi:hypothetical protein
MSRAVKQAENKGDEVSGVMAGWGVGAGDITVDDVDDIIELAENGGFAELAKLLGRARKIALQTIDDVKQNSVEAVSKVAMTKDPTRIFPSELIMMSPDSPLPMRAEKVSQFIYGHGLLGWEPIEQGKESGSFIAYVDGSGSMSGVPIRIAKAVAMGVAQTVREELDEGRYYELHEFAVRTDEELPWVTSEQGWREHITWAKMFLSGWGTDFDFAFEKAAERLKAVREMDIRSADFLFITDGIAHLSDDDVRKWKELSEEMSIRLLTVQIGDFNNPQIKELSDSFIIVPRMREFNADFFSELAVGLTQMIAEHHLLNGTTD